MTIPAVVTIFDLPSGTLSSSALFEASQTTAGVATTIAVSALQIGQTALTSLLAGTAGLPLLGTGSTTLPAFGVLQVIGGGVGTTTFPAFQVVVANGTAAFTTADVSTTGFVLVGNGSAAAPSFQLINLTSSVTGVLTVPNGGTGTSTLTANRVLVGNGVSTIALTNVATTGFPLVGNGTLAAPGFAVLGVVGGGLGTATTTPYALLSGGTTATSQVQSLATTGASGTLLVSQGAAALPVWSASVSARTKLLASTNFFIRTDGSNSNNGLANTTTGAFQTFQGAYDNINNNYDLAGFLATVNVASGIYTSGLLVLGPQPVGTPSSTNTGIQFVGDTTTPANVTISTTGICVAASFGGSIMIGGIKMQSASSKGIYAAAHGRVNLTNNVEFGLCLDVNAHANVDGVIVFNSGFLINSGTTQSNGCLYADKCSTIELNASTVTVGTSSFITFATSINEATLSAPGVAFATTGPVTGQRFNADGAKIAIGTTNVNYFPGSTPGVCINGGVYNTGLLSSTSTALVGDVNLSSTTIYFDGPSVAQGTTGTWYVSGTVTVTDTVQALMLGKLWDGSTVIDSAEVTVATGYVQAISLSGVLASPVGNLRISVRDFSATSGSIKANSTGNSKDSSITAIRIA